MSHRDDLLRLIGEKRVQARTLGQIAFYISIQTHRQVLLDQAKSLEQEAAWLEQEVANLDRRAAD